eukprot:g2119.t1
MSVFDIKEEAFEVIIDGKKYVGHLAYQELSPRPLVLIFPNVAGLKGFDQQKAYEMAELGYVGLAVDLYGDHTIPFKDREDALGSALPQIFGFMNELLCDKVELHKRMKAFLDAGLAHPAVDTSHGWAATGYCFGGACVAELVRGGDFNPRGVVSFHGTIDAQPMTLDPSVPAPAIKTTVPGNYSSDTRVLIENGEQDPFVPDAMIKGFRDEMNANEVMYTIHNYAQAGHAFAMPDHGPGPGIPGVGYQERAHRYSTLAMRDFFRYEVFPNVGQRLVGLDQLHYHGSIASL